VKKIVVVSILLKVYWKYCHFGKVLEVEDLRTTSFGAPKQKKWLVIFCGERNKEKKLIVLCHWYWLEHGQPPVISIANFENDRNLSFIICNSKCELWSVDNLEFFFLGTMYNLDSKLICSRTKWSELLRPNVHRIKIYCNSKRMQ
jgi:hypothetical protein